MISVDETLFSLREVSYAHPDGEKGKLVLKEITLDVVAGRSVAIMGLSGKGKSTLLRLMAGLISPMAGEVRFRGRVLQGPRREIGIVFQHYEETVFDWLTSLENVALAATKHNSTSLTRASLLLDRLGFDDTMKCKKAKLLSGGEKQRVAIGRSLMQDAAVVLLDEPFASLDTIKRRDLIALLEELTGSLGTTFVVVSHDIEETLHATKQVYCLLSATNTPQLRPMVWDDANLTTDQELVELVALMRSRAEHIMGVLEQDLPEENEDGG